jgi:hypothetical protein
MDVKRGISPFRSGNDDDRNQRGPRPESQKDPSGTGVVQKKSKGAPKVNCPLSCHLVTQGPTQGLVVFSQPSKNLKSEIGAPRSDRR